MTARLVDLRPVYVAGVGLHRYRKPTDTPYTDLALAAVRAALADAGITWTSVETAVCGTANLGLAAGWTALRHLGATGIPVMQVENASATGSTAFRDVVLQVASGVADCGLALGVDKVLRPRLAVLNAGTPDLVRGAAPPAVGFALEAKRHMRRHGTTLDQLALVSVKNHWNGARNPNAQFQRECTREEVHQAPPIVDPFTTLHCCPLGEGAATAIVVSEEGLQRLGISRRRSLRVLCSVANSETLTPPGESLHVRITRDAVSRAYDETGLGPGDLDVIELHEAFTIEEILYIEAMGLCAEGEGGPFTESRATWIGGDCAVNASGGLLAMGHPFGPTGIGQIVEIARQLRGEAGDRQHQGARLGLAHMVGVGEVCVVHILSREH